MTGNFQNSIFPVGGLSMPFAGGVPSAGAVPGAAFQAFPSGAAAPGMAMPGLDAAQIGWQTMRELGAMGPGGAFAEGMSSQFKGMIERMYMMALLEQLMKLLFMVMGVAALKAASGTDSNSSTGAAAGLDTGTSGASGSTADSGTSSVGGAGTADVSPGGGWAGTEEPVKELTKLAGNGFSVTSAKRDTQMTASGNVSDHYIGNKTAYAHDIGWGSSQPTAASDAAASRIVAALGGPSDWGRKGGVFSTTIKGIRYQVLYKTNVGGNHFNHIHLGAKRVG